MPAGCLYAPNSFLDKNPNTAQALTTASQDVEIAGGKLAAVMLRGTASVPSSGTASGGIDDTVTPAPSASVTWWSISPVSIRSLSTAVTPASARAGGCWRG